MAKIIEDEATEVSTEQNPVAEAAAATEVVSTENAGEQGSVEAQAPTPEKAKAEPVDLTKFTETLNSAVASVGADGSPTPEAIAAVQTGYGELDGSKAKAAARKLVQAEMKKAVQAKEMPRALAITILEENMTKGAKAKTPKAKAEAKPVDPTEAYVASRLTLTLGLGLLPKPEGLADDVEEQVTTQYGELYPQTEAYLAWLSGDKDSRGDEPEASDVVKNAAKLALGKKTKSAGRSSGGGSTYTGPRRNVNEHISEVFSSQASGTALKIGEVAKVKTSIYPEGDASPGAITSRADSGKLPEGISADKRDGVRVLVKA